MSLSVSSFVKTVAGAVSVLFVLCGFVGLWLSLFKLTVDFIINHPEWTFWTYFLGSLAAINVGAIIIVTFDVG